MTSPPAITCETCYHIFARGNNRVNIFVQERNYQHFIKLYARYIDPVAETFAFCLLKNHFHLLVRIKAEDEIRKTCKTLKVSLAPNYPSRRFSNFLNAYAKAINTAYGRTGSLFQHPFGRVVVKDERQLCNVIAYIHQNPQKHKFVADFREWPWSSYGMMLSEKPTHLRRAEVLEWFGGKQHYVEQHAQMVGEAESKGFVAEAED